MRRLTGRKAAVPAGLDYRILPTLFSIQRREARIGVNAMARKTKNAYKKSSENAGGEVRLLSGGNPQIAKADGDAPVQKYIAHMPGWKSGLGRSLDDLIVRTVPGVRKAGEVEFALVRGGGGGMVRELPRVHPLCEGDFSEWGGA